MGAEEHKSTLENQKSFDIINLDFQELKGSFMLQQECSKCHEREPKVKFSVNRKKCNICIYVQRRKNQTEQQKVCAKCEIMQPGSNFTPGKKTCNACCYSQNKKRNQHQRVCAKCNKEKPAAKFHPYARTCDKCCNTQQTEKLKIYGSENLKTAFLIYPPFTVVRKLTTHGNNHKELENVNENVKR